MSIMKKLLPIVLMGAMLTFPKIADATEKWQYCSGVMATDWHYSTEKNYSHEQDVLSVVDYLKEMNLRGYDPRDFNLKELRENVPSSQIWAVYDLCLNSPQDYTDTIKPERIETDWDGSMRKSHVISLDEFLERL